MNSELDGLSNIVESMAADMRRDMQRQIWSEKPLPPLTRWQRFRGTVRWKVDDLRQRAAERISPYGLDDDRW